MWVYIVHAGLLATQIVALGYTYLVLTASMRARLEAREQLKSTQGILDRANLQIVSRAVFAHHAPVKMTTTDEGTN